MNPFRYKKSNRSRNRRTRIARPLPLHLISHVESLEDRTLLDANVIALVQDTIAAGMTRDLTLDVGTGGLTQTVLGLQMRAADGSMLDPAEIIVTDAATMDVVAPILSEADRGDANEESLLVVSLPSGEFIVTVGGDGGTAGDFDFTIFFPGDLGQDGSVDNQELQQSLAAAIQAGIGINPIAAEFFRQQGLDVSIDLFRDELDANLDNQIDGFDVTQITTNTNAPQIDVAADGTANDITLIGDDDPPVIVAALVNDTGDDMDGVTSELAIAGTVMDASEIVTFMGGFDVTPVGSFTNLLMDLGPDGAFTLDQTRLEVINGGSLANDGPHTLHLIASDEIGNDSPQFDVTFTFDTAPFVANAIDDETADEDAVDSLLDLSDVFGDVPDGSGLTLSVQNNTNGTLVTTMLAGTMLTLDFQDDQNGTADITIRATDAGGSTVDNTFTVTVNPIDDDPFVDTPIGAQMVQEDATDTVIDLDSIFDDADIATNGDSLTFMVTNNTDGTLVSTSVNGSMLTLDFQDDQNGTADITVQATDSSMTTVEDTFTVTVNAVNDDPTVANATDNQTVDEDAADLVLNLADVFADVDIATNADSLTLSVQNNTNGALVTTMLVGTMLTLDFQDNQNGSADITIRATDLAGATVDDTFTVTVDPINDDPVVVTPIDDQMVDEDASDTVIDLGPLFGDVDIATNGDSLTFTVTNNTDGTLVSTSINGSMLTLDFQDNQNGTANITVQATDSDMATVDDTFMVTVNAVNDDPTVANATDNQTVDEDASDLVLDLADVFADVDIATNADSLTLSVQNNTNGTLVTTMLVGTMLTLDFQDNQNGSADITIRATDLAGAMVDDTFTVTVDPINDDPIVVTPIDDQMVDEDAGDTVIDLGPLFGDVDIATNGDSLTFMVTNNTDGSLVSTSINGSMLTLDFQDDQNGTANITVQATDSDMATVDDTFMVTVNAVNDDPTVANGTDNQTVDEDASDLVLDLADVFADVDIATNADSLTLTVENNSNGTLVTTILVGTMLTLDFQDDQNGTADITIRATDLAGAMVDDTFTVTVDPINDDPVVVTPIDDQMVDEDAVDTVIDLGPLFGDVDIATNGDSLTFTVTNNTNGTLVSTSINGSMLTLDFQDEQNGTADITVKATDSDMATVSDTFMVTVNAVNDDPTAVDDTLSVANNQATGLDVLDNDLDPDLFDATPDELTIVTVPATASQNGTVELVEVEGRMLVRYTPVDLFGTDGTSETFMYTIEDTGGAQSTGTVTVNVFANQAPDIVNPIDDEMVDEDADDLVIDISDVFNDFEDGAALTLSVQANSNTGLVDATLNGTMLTLDFQDDQNGTADITIRATDSAAATTDDTFTVTVAPQNDAPTLDAPIVDVDVDEDAGDDMIDLATVFGDVDIATNGETLSFSVVSNNNMSLVGTSVLGSVLTLDYLDNQNGMATITVRATEDQGEGLIIENTFDVTVNEMNDTPTVENTIDDVMVDEDADDVVIDLADVFGDVDIVTNGDSLTLSVETNTDIALVATSLNGDMLTLDFQDDANGMADITIRATDLMGASIDTTFSVTVDPVNDAPELVSPIGDLLRNDAENPPVDMFDLNMVFQDVDGDALTFMATSDNEELVTVQVTGGDTLEVSYLDFEGAQNRTPANITVTAMDMTESAEEMLTATVTPEVTFELQVFVLNQPTAVTQSETLPTSVDSVIVGSSFFVEVWFTDLLVPGLTGLPVSSTSRGVTGTGVDVLFDTLLVDGVSIDHDGAFQITQPQFQTGTFDEGNGRVENFGNGGLDDDIAIAPVFGRLGILEFMATDEGMSTFSLELDGDVSDTARRADAPAGGTVDASQIRIGDAVTVTQLPLTSFDLIMASSNVTVSGTLQGVPTITQFAGSDMTQIMGTIDTVVDDLDNPTTIQIVSANLDLVTDEDVLPGENGVNVAEPGDVGLTTDPVDLSGGVFATLTVALREAVASLSTDGAVDVTGFGSALQDWEVIAGFGDSFFDVTLDFLDEMGRDDLIGNLTDNGAADATLIDIGSGILELTIPFDRTLDISAVTETAGDELVFTGTITAQFDTGTGFRGEAIPNADTFETTVEVWDDNFSAFVLRPGEARLLVGKSSSADLMGASNAQLQEVAGRARDAWTLAFPASSSTVIQYVVSNYPSSKLGESQILATNADGTPSLVLVVIDADAGSYGWSIDADKPAPEAYDLYTVLQHEIGHGLGLRDHVSSEILDLMNDTLGLGERRLISQLDVDLLAEVYARSGDGSVNLKTAALYASLTQETTVAPLNNIQEVVVAVTIGDDDVIDAQPIAILSSNNGSVTAGNDELQVDEFAVALARNTGEQIDEAIKQHDRSPASLDLSSDVAVETSDDNGQLIDLMFADDLMDQLINGIE